MNTFTDSMIEAPAGQGKTDAALRIADELEKQGKNVIIKPMFPTPIGDGRYQVNGIIYTTLHAAMRAMSDARLAQPVEYQPKPETERERARRERREATGR